MLRPEDVQEEAWRLLQTVAREVSSYDGGYSRAAYEFLLQASNNYSRLEEFLEDYQPEEEAEADSDLALLLEERESERRVEAHEAPGVSQGNWEDDHQPYWRS